MVSILTLIWYQPFLPTSENIIIEQLLSLKGDLKSNFAQICVYLCYKSKKKIQIILWIPSSKADIFLNLVINAIIDEIYLISIVRITKYTTERIHILQPMNIIIHISIRFKRCSRCSGLVLRALRKCFSFRSSILNCRILPRFLSDELQFSSCLPIKDTSIGMFPFMVFNPSPFHCVISEHSESAEPAHEIIQMRLYIMDFRCNI